MMVKGEEKRNAKGAAPPPPRRVPPSHLSIRRPPLLPLPSIPISLLKRLVNVRWELSSSSMASSFFIETLSICACARVCACTSKDVEGKTSKWNEIEPAIGNWKWLLSTEEQTLARREENLEVVLRS